MPVYTYTAVDAKGQRTSGSVPAASRAAALDAVIQKGLVPASVEEQGAEQAAPGAMRLRLGLGSRRVSQSDVEAFSRELANLLTAGVPLARALQILTREASQSAARAQWATVRDDVIGGMSLADALAKYPQSFPPVHVAMVRAGETGGFLDVVLGQIADFRARERDLKSRVRGALVYPAVLMVLASAVLLVLMLWFIPRFSGVFETFGAQLPALTKAIIATSKFSLQYGWLIAIVLAAVGLVTYRSLQSDAGRRLVERTTLRIPGLGVVLARFALVRFCRMLGTLLGAGVPLVTSLRVSREAIGNQTLADAVALSIEEVQQGKPLSRSLASCRQLFPPTVIEMIAVAEESSRLDKELTRLSLSYESDLDRRLRTLVTLAEPLMLFTMAAVVGTIVIGMLLPIFTLQDYVK
jgi:type II secretory pathway component PulF